jgi:hypothetical protein
VTDHQPVPAGIVHLVQLQIGVGLEQWLGVAGALGHGLVGPVDTDALLSHGDQTGLRQPWMPSRAQRWVRAPFEEPMATPG